MDEKEIIIKINELFDKDSKYYTEEDIRKKLNIKGEEQLILLNKTLEVLIEEGILFEGKNGYYKLFSKVKDFAFGQININKNGTGFVHTSDGYIILIENCDLNGALNKDNVVVSNIYSKRKDYYSGEIYKVVKRYNENVVFEVVGNGKCASLIPYNINDNVSINIKNYELADLVDGTLVLVKVGCQKINDFYEASIVKTIGYKNDPDIDIKLILEKYDIPITFSEEIESEAKSLPKEVEEDELINRVDLRRENVFTIDCDSTKDRDDAVSIKKLDNGNYLLKVSIAHVSHYITEDTKSYEEALIRCMSHYPSDSCIPMLHPIISNGICSLNPGVDRLTRTVAMEINEMGEVVNYEIYNSVINSRIAMSYSKVNEVLDGNILDEYIPYIEDLKLMEELNNILNKAREKRNYINFNTLEIEAHKDSYGEIISFTNNNYKTAGQIIENFMLLANTTVYNHYSWFILPYRVHEAPSDEKVKDVIKVLKSSNINIPKINNISARSLKTIIERLDNTEVALIVREYLLKSMQKATYDTNNKGHFALQYDIYGHFTSPIRRLPDLLMHMIIDKIESFDYSENSLNNFEAFLNDTCKRVNKIEKIDRIIEEETLEMLMAKYMEHHIGEEFSAYITDIGKNSMFVRTTNLIKGKIKLSNIYDDNYYYDDNKKAIVGRKTKKKYQIGNKVVVLVKDACTSTRTVNFEIPNEKVLTKKNENLT